MRLIDKVYNINEDIKIILIKYMYIISPLLGIIIYIVLLKLTSIKLDDNFMPNLINISGVLAGFLFTSLGIMVSLPENKFTKLLKETNYIRIIYNSMIIGIMSFLVAMLLGLFSINDKISKFLFIIGISETFLSAYYLYRVSYYSGKSK